jgi:hypothetical protein
MINYNGYMLSKIHAFVMYFYTDVPDCAVDIATRYGLDGPGIEPQWWRDFPYPSRPNRGPPNLLYNGYRVFPVS